jgi:hypothetical protein
MSHFDNDRALIAAIRDLKSAVEAGTDLLRVALHSLDRIEKGQAGPAHVIAHPYNPASDPSHIDHNRYDDY